MSPIAFILNDLSIEAPFYSFPARKANNTRENDPFEGAESDLSSGDESDDNEEGTSDSSEWTSEAESALYLTPGEFYPLLASMHTYRSF